MYSTNELKGIASMFGCGFRHNVVMVSRDHADGRFSLQLEPPLDSIGVVSRSKRPAAIAKFRWNGEWWVPADKSAQAIGHAVDSLRAIMTPH